MTGIKATPYKARLTALYEICLHILRYLAQKSLDIRQYACDISIQADEKSDFASFAQVLCGIALQSCRKNSVQNTVIFIKTIDFLTKL